MPISLTSPKARRAAIVAAIAIVAVGGMIALSGVWSGPHQLQATVHCDSQRFKVTNNDQFTWTNVDLELNRGSVLEGGKDGYHYRPGDVPGGHTITFLCSQFTSADKNTHFNATTERLGEIRITADLPGGGKGLYTYNW